MEIKQSSREDEPANALPNIEIWPLSFAYSESLSGGLLLCQSNSLLVFGALLDVLCLLGNKEFDVAVSGKVGSDSTVGSVGSSSALNGSLNCDVGDHALINIQTFSFSICMDILE